MFVSPSMITSSDLSSEFSAPSQEKLLKLSPTIAYSIRKLLRQHSDRLQSVVAQGAAFKADDFSDLDKVVQSLYLEPQEINSVIHQLEQLAMSHEALSTQNGQFVEERRNIEEKIFWLLGYKLNRSLHHRTILLVDDTPAYLRYLSSTLTQKGYEVCTANNGTAALKLVQDVIPDLILLDITMPGIDGYEVCKRLKARSQTQQIPIVFLSGTNEPSDKLKAFEVGGVDYISKPFQVEEVLARIQIHLQQHSRQRHLEHQNACLEQEIKERRKTEEQYRSFFENSVDGMFQATSKGQFLRVNQALATLYGYESPEELTTVIADITHQLYVDPHHRANFLAALEKTGIVTDFEVQVYRKDGTVIWISKSARAIRDQFDNLLCYEGTIKNITHRKRTETALDQNQQLLQQIVDKTDALIFAKEYLQTDGTYILVNRKFADQFNVGLDRYFGKTDHDIFPEAVATAFRQADQQVLELSSPIQVEESVPDEDGDRISLVTKFPLFNSEGQLYAVCGIATDISDRKQSEIELRRTKYQLQQQVQKLEHTIKDFKQHQTKVLQQDRTSSLQLLSGITEEIEHSTRLIYSHLRASYRQIQDLSLSFEYSSGEDPAQQLFPKLMTVRSKIDRIHQLTAALQMFCRLDQPESEEIDIHECIDNALLLLSSQLKSQLVRVGDTEFLRPAIEIVQAYGYLPKIKCYPGQMHQLFFNLILNAIEAMKWSKSQSPSEIPTESSKLEIQTVQVDASEVMIRILDQGVGISEELRSNIFEPYFTTKSKAQGMGLAICSQIVERHQGQIEVVSNVGQGTEVRVTLPVFI